MNTPNPYDSSLQAATPHGSSRWPGSRWALIGGLGAALLPIGFAIDILYREMVYAASLPPGSTRCGMGMLAALMLVIVGSPVLGSVGALIGWGLSRLWSRSFTDR